MDNVIEDADIIISDAVAADQPFVSALMDEALEPFYGGDHRAHAQRIITAHLAGGKDNIGFFSYEQRMFVLTVGGERAGLVHLVGKRQDTYKISPLILSPTFRGRGGLGTRLLLHAEDYAAKQGARQLYCTVADANQAALQFFLRRGFVPAGRSDSHYKRGITEIMLYKRIEARELEDERDRPNISVLPFELRHADQVRHLLLEKLPRTFYGIDNRWVDGLFNGYNRRDSRDVNAKYKLIHVAVDRQNEVLGVSGATPKKGEPIKWMPFIAQSLPAFAAMLSDVPYQLREYGRKVYMHIAPTVEETVALQQRGWRLDAALPGAYHDNVVTQQWSLNIDGDDFMRVVRVKRPLLEKIQAREKTLEIRVGYSNIKTIRRGELIKFESGPLSQVVRVRGIRTYADFSTMMDAEDYSRIVPGMDRIQVQELLHQIYPPEREKLGVYVLEIEAETLQASLQNTRALSEA